MLQSSGCDVIIQGFSGTIYKSTLECMHKLRIEKTRNAALLSALHMSAIMSLHSKVKLRRLLERNCRNNRRKYASRNFQRALTLSVFNPPSL